MSAFPGFHRRGYHPETFTPKRAWRQSEIDIAHPQAVPPAEHVLCGTVILHFTRFFARRDNPGFPENYPDHTSQNLPEYLWPLRPIPCSGYLPTRKPPLRVESHPPSINPKSTSRSTQT